MTFHLNGNEIHISHIKNAHTDGDSIVHFRDANVIHTGMSTLLACTRL